MKAVSRYDVAYRPSTYWETPDAVFARIKGEGRRRRVRKLLAAGDFGALEDRLLSDSLSDPERLALGSMGPGLMGGEYLPEYEEEEVEIARVVLRSTTGDVISIRARRHGSLIRYRVVDEYDTPFQCEPEESASPLTLGELIALIDSTTKPMCDRRGLTSRFRDENLGRWTAPEALVDFVTVTSPFYPQLERYYDEEARKWLAAVKGRPVGTVERRRQEHREQRIPWWWRWSLWAFGPRP